jgi:phospholipid/cholesterol/gamma-HCH transport system ATP-binding protein
MPPISLQLLPGELALIEANDPRRAAWFADLCCGLVRLAEGTVTFLGRDWTAMPRDHAAALRGRIGRVFAEGGWIEFVDMATNVLLPQLHHTRRDGREVREEAAKLACVFGLPGLPMGRPRDLSTKDLARAACIRAFLGEPALLLLEALRSLRRPDSAADRFLTSARQNGATRLAEQQRRGVGRPFIHCSQRLRLRTTG